MINYKVSGGSNNNIPTTLAPSDITFYDYDGTIVASWTLEELATKTALPDYPSHKGLRCQGWNWSLVDLKTTNRKMNVGAMYITKDKKTRIYIRLEEGRTYPMLGICLNGTVTVDWGDGTTPDILTGTGADSPEWTQNHEYAAPGEYVIELKVSYKGTMDFAPVSSPDEGSAILRYDSSEDEINRVYQNSVQKIEIGENVTYISDYAFSECHSLTSITIPDHVMYIGQNAFSNCYSLASITIPNGVTSIESSAFVNCSALKSITLPNSVTSIGLSTFNTCYSLASITIPNGVTSIGGYAFNTCYSLASITFPNSVTSIESSTFNTCDTLASITIPNGVTSIGSNAFHRCHGVAYYDFTACTTVPTLKNANAFTGIPADCQIRVPASLVDEWKTETNWATLADFIVGV